MSAPASLRQRCALGRAMAVVAVGLLVIVGTYLLSAGDGDTEEFFSVRRIRSSDAAAGGDDLEAALRGAADANRTLIVTVLNRAYAAEDGGLLDLFLRSLREGEGTAQLIGHILLVATDRPAFLRCRRLGGVRCYQLPPAAADGADDLSSEQLYMSDGFIRMMWRRIRLLGDVLKLGYSFIFTDLDVMWLRNPLPRLEYRPEEEDLLISSDQFNGRADDYAGNELNTGFFFAASNTALFDEWHAAREAPASAGMKEQDKILMQRYFGVRKLLQPIQQFFV
uniref:Nucleotide-diphospho-sugar transferase domain-containing protein n=1 Tax=Oryza brachyantha TaxID=4533 RepID=J3LSI7_ORYBR